jgi:hypothetical protein
MTNFGTPRNTTTKVRAECLADVPEEVAMKSHGWFTVSIVCRPKHFQNNNKLESLVQARCVFSRVPTDMPRRKAWSASGLFAW